MNDLDDRLTPEQRRAIDARISKIVKRNAPSRRDGFFWLLIPILLALAILAGLYSIMGCAAGDANGIKMLFGGEPEPRVTRQHTEDIQTFTRDGKREATKAKEEATVAARESIAANTKLDKIVRVIDTTARVAEQIVFWTAVGVPTLTGVAASLRVYSARKKTRARATNG